MSVRPPPVPVGDPLSTALPRHLPIRAPPFPGAASTSHLRINSIVISPSERRSPMEMRLLTTEREREVFAQRLAEARAKHGACFRDVGPTQVHNRLRLDSSCLYALFAAECDSAQQMVAGVALHDLEAFPQSCHVPDLSHLPPRSVLECRDHWSLSG